MKFKKILMLMTIFSIFGCSSIDPKTYSNNSPKLDIREYLNGKLEARGVLQGRSGEVKRSFTVKMIGTWKGNEGTLEEDFVFSDGEKDRRVWKLKLSDDHNFTATAHDVVGIAKGQQYGNAMKMAYVLDVKAGNKSYDISMVDWIYLIDDKNAINVTKMSKFGFKVGTLSISFNKL